MEVREKVVADITPRSSSTSLYNSKSVRFCILASLFYLALSYILIGFKTDQLILVLLFNTLYFFNRTTRRLITGFSIFIVYWIVFDYMKAFPNFEYNKVHIESLYNLEKSLFGFKWNGIVVTANEYLAQHSANWLNVLTGIFYLCWIPVPLFFAALLFFKNRNYFFQFSLTFLLVNLIGFVIYYVYPAAPPWYVAQYGFDFIASTPGHTAGLGRFDALFGVHVFENIYSKSSNVFAAMPSLHASYMLIVLYYGIKNRMKGYNYLFALVMLGIWFSAVYNGHHYILDILAGIICAVLGIALFQFFIRKTLVGRKLMVKMITLTR